MAPGAGGIGGSDGVFLAVLHSRHRLVSDPASTSRSSRDGVNTRPPERATSPTTPRRTLLQRLVEFLAPGPDSRDELIETLADAEQRELIEPESRIMLEG